MASLDSVGGQVQSRTAAVADQNLHVEKPLPQRDEANDKRQRVDPTGQNSPHVPEPSERSGNAADSQEVRESVAEVISNYSQNISRELRFTVDESEGRVVITVFNKETNEIIRQIPSEEIMELARKMKDSQGLSKGLLVNLVS